MEGSKLNSRTQQEAPFALLVVGVPGAGKTHFSRQFALEYKLNIISLERLQSDLAELPHNQAERLAKKISLSIIEQLAQSKKNIILEGNFSSLKERLDMALFVKKLGYKFLVLWIQTDLETSQERATSRDRRNLDSRYALQHTDDSFNQYVQAFEKPDTTRENFMVVSGKHAFSSQSLSVLKKIASLYVDHPAGKSLDNFNRSSTGGIRVQ
jgi:predicted kinase